MRISPWRSLALLFLLSLIVASPPAAADGYWRDDFVDNGLNAWTFCVESFEDMVIAGGRFTCAGADSAHRIAAWDGQQWQAYTVGIAGFSSVYALHEYDGYLYVGGDFTWAGDIPADNIAKWSPDQGWFLPVGHFNSLVRDMVTFEGDLYVSGGFSAVEWDEPVHTGPIARWDGSQWSSLGEPGSQDAYCMRIIDGEVVIGGNFYSMGGNHNLRRLARWNGETWSSFHPSGCDSITGNVQDVIGFMGDVYICGGFQLIEGQAISYLARWNGSEWQAVGEEVWGAVMYGCTIEALEVYNGALFVAGAFSLRTPWETDCIMRFDGENWSTCGLGAAGTISELNAIPSGADETLYAVGAFEMAGGISSPHIAAWQEENLTAAPSEPAAFAVLHPCIPNPFNARTRISFTLDEPAELRLDLHSVDGRRLATLAEGRHDAGAHELNWSGHDDQGNALASGVYLLRLQTGNSDQVQKIVLAK